MLLVATPLGEEKIRLFGKEFLQPRLVGWCSTLPYQYSGRTLEPRPLNDATKAIWESVQRQTGQNFNHLLINLYRNGSDSMGAHADDEPELGHRPQVASLSLGAHRTFSWIPKAPASPGSKRKGKRVELGEGDLLLMSGAFQEQFLHSVPKTKKQVGPRLNLTFRQVSG